MISGISHITLIVRNLDRMEEILSNILDARKIYDSGVKLFSLSKERFFLVGDGAEPIWIATMEGEPPRAKTYDHVAFKIAESDYDKYLGRIGNMGLQLREGRSRVEGEGRSIYFYDHDNHLFELHTGTLHERLKRYAKLGNF